MDSMWLEVILNTKAEDLDDLCAKLIANGVPGLAVEEEEEFRAFLEENRQYWDYVDDALLEQMKGVSRVKLYVTDDADGQAQLNTYLAGIDLPYTTVPLREYDWAHSWQKYYRPLAVGESLYIVPEWERDTAAVPEGAVRLLMNPGLTFGTGSHASTQLCLEGVEAHVQPGDRVLDLGCGSGILAIAALCLGAAQAVGVDIDPKAVDVAYENAALNGIGREKCRFLAGNVLADPALVEDAYASTHGRSRSLTGDIEPPAKNIHIVSEPVSAPQLPDGEPEQSGPEEPPAQPRDDETPPPQDGEGPNEKPEQDRP